MTPTLATALREARILLTCGTGGVGKTTIAAVLGLAAAQAGRRTLVLTIDPAQRLANALGLPAFTEHVQPTRLTTRDGLHLDCLMLNAKRVFDRVIERHAPDTATARAILSNPLYQQLSATIAGSQEYMAMEQLYEMTTQYDYDLIVVDTPPSHHAIDFFQAPDRLVNAINDSVLRLFLKPSMVAGKWGAQLLSKGATTFMKLFGRMTGAEMLQEISDLLMSTVSLLSGFDQRATLVRDLLRQPTTGMILVTTAHPPLLADALDFLAQAQAQALHLSGIVINRVTPTMAAATPPLACPRFVMRNYEHLQAQRAAEAQALRVLDAYGVVPRVLMAQRAGDIHQLERLLTMAEALVVA